MNIHDTIARHPRNPTSYPDDWYPIAARFLATLGTMRKLADTVRNGYDAKAEAADAVALYDLLINEHDQWLGQRNAAHARADREAVS